MPELKEADPVLSPMTASNLRYACGLALAYVVAILVGQLIDAIELGRPAFSVIDPGPVSLALLAGFFAFFTGWIAATWTNSLDEYPGLRIIVASFLTAFGPLLMAALTASFVSAGALGLGVFFVGMKFIGWPSLIASIAWSFTFFMCRRRKQKLSEATSLLG